MSNKIPCLLVAFVTYVPLTYGVPRARLRCATYVNAPTHEGVIQFLEGRAKPHLAPTCALAVARGFHSTKNLPFARGVQTSSALHAKHRTVPCVSRGIALKRSKRRPVQEVRVRSAIETSGHENTWL